MPSPRFEAGAARVEITPPLGGVLAGYASRTEASNDLDDPLSAKALALRLGEVEAAIVIADLVGVPGEVVRAVRSRVRERTGIPQDHVLVAATHTHFGPALNWASYYRSNLKKNFDTTWAEVTARQVASAVELAHRRLQPARLGAAIGSAPNISYNRRMRRPDGKVEMVLVLPPPTPGLKFGPKDPEVGVLRIDGREGNPIGSLVNFAAHPVCGAYNLYGISADYPAQATGLVEKERGGVCLFALGAAGDIVPFVRRGDARQRIGGALGAEALKCLIWTKTRRPSSLRVCRRSVRLPLKDFPSVAEAKRLVAAAEGRIRKKGGKGRTPEDLKAPAMDVAYAHALLGYASQFHGVRSLRTEVQAMAIGDTVLVGLPGEIFVEIGLEIKRRSPFRHTFVISLANDSIGYVPTAQEYDAGGYEPVWNKVAPTAAAQLTAAALQAIEALRP